ncbi:MAG: TetR/AcrR family transcriptional regulator [Candidatus Hydrogenedentota bacterium]|nr:MAG: TetR/AcrR family transcriptional regulator [Candidatus Hydrogenedentota bacterium]
MGRKAIAKERVLDPQMRQEMAFRLLPLFMSRGFRRVTMNEITRQLGISKATFYQHFESQDELYALSIELLLKQIGDAKPILKEKSLSYEDRFLHLFAIVLKQVLGLSPILLEDMKYHYPDLWQRLQDYYVEWENTLAEFFKEAMEQQAFRDVHPAIVSRLITVVLREFLNPEFLTQNQITVEQAFTDLLHILGEGFFLTETEPESLKEKVRNIIASSLLPNFSEIPNLSGLSIVKGDEHEKMD